MSHCSIAYEVEEYQGVSKCPVCGKYMKWHGWDKGYSCKCNGIINIRGSGDEEIDEEPCDYALRICKKPEGWNRGIFFEDTDPVYWSSINNGEVRSEKQ